MGIIASEGIAIGKVIVVEEAGIVVDKKVVDDFEKEIKIFNQTILDVVNDLDVVIENVKNRIGNSEAEIFEAHKLICEDVEIISNVEEEIKNYSVSCSYAYQTVMNNFIELFNSMDDEYMKARASDIEDVKNRVLRKLLDIEEVNLALVDEDSVIIADDLTPSTTSQLNKFIKGFITMTGGKTSHSAIIARSLEIAALVGVKQNVDYYKSIDTIVIDAIDNKIVVNPSEEEINFYKEKLDGFNKEKQEWKKQLNNKVYSNSGKEIIIAANVATREDVIAAKAVNANGIGLLRTEFLYMEGDSLPSEEKQYEFYKYALDAFPNEKVVIRTLDIGGDKNLDYLKFDPELNPFLGVRAIRFCFEHLDIFRTQIRALLRANTHGNLCIMFPMIATVDEFLRAKEFVKECESELINEGIEVNLNYQLGTMVEIPAVAIVAFEFAKYVDFFSIGTNDLIQYTMASDRMNEKLNYLYQPMNSAITTLIKNVVEASKSANIWVGICGEMAGDTEYSEFLKQLDLDELSMNPKSVLKVKHKLNN